MISGLSGKLIRIFTLVGMAHSVALPVRIFAEPSVITPRLVIEFPAERIAKRDIPLYGVQFLPKGGGLLISDSLGVSLWDTTSWKKLNRAERADKKRRPMGNRAAPTW